MQKRFLADKQLDKKLEQTILMTALKVVQRQTAAATATAAAQADGEAGNPTRKLDFVEQVRLKDASPGCNMVVLQCPMQLSCACHTAHLAPNC